jgi:hypothetical protein
MIEPTIIMVFSHLDTLHTGQTRSQNPPGCRQIAAQFTNRTVGEQCP